MAIGRRRGLGPVAALVIAVGTVAGCSGEDKEHADPSPESGSPVATCFERLDDGGDLEVTDSGFTVFNPDDPNGDYWVTAAVEVTNTSATETMMVADLTMWLLDSEGVRLPGESPEDETEVAAGRLKFIEPGGSAYFGEIIRTSKSHPPDRVAVTIEPSYWRAESEVTYPERLVGSDVTVLDEGDDEPILEFTVASETEHEVTWSQVIFRDDRGNLVGGGRMPGDPLLIEPGSHEYRIGQLLRYVMPPNTDRDSIEVHLDNAPPWREVEPACLGVGELVEW